MNRKTKKGQVYRYVPAFILLFLAQENLYGAAMYNRMKKEVPYCHADSSVIYRSLQELEEEGAVTAYWETDIAGPARKWYQIEAPGKEKLSELKGDIEKSKRNLDFFLNAYQKI